MICSSGCNIGSEEGDSGGSRVRRRMRRAKKAKKFETFLIDFQKEGRARNCEEISPK